MPYVRKGNCVYKKDTGEKVGCSTNPAKAERYRRKLEMETHKEEHPKGKK